MLKDYEEIFQEYKNKSVDLLEKLNSDDYVSANNLLGEREGLIHKIKQLCLSKETIKEQVQKYDIMELEDKIKTLLSFKMKQVKSNIDKLGLIGKANTSYHKNFYGTNRIFSKRV